MSGLRITRLAETAFPLEVNTLFVDAAGELNRIDPRERPFGFTFECLGLRFSASTRVRRTRLWLKLAAKIGPVPYTAESLARRREALAIIRATLALPHGKLGLTRDGHIEVSGEVPLREPFTPVNVVSAAAGLVLEIKPYVTLLGDFVPSAWRPAAG